MILKVAHISDLHISRKNKVLNERFDELLKDISKNKIDHLFITGDIIHNPEENDYNAVINKLKKYGYFSRDRLSVCIGNHEIYGGAEHGGKSYLFPYRCRNTDKEKKVKEFCEYFKETLPEGQADFPYSKEIGNVVIFGLNSVSGPSLETNPIGSNGVITDKGLKQIRKLINGKKNTKKIKTVLIHHHFYYTSLNPEDEIFTDWLYTERSTMQLHNRQNIIKLFGECGIKTVYHGHTHINETYIRSGIRFINSSGCLLPFSKKREYEYSIINYLI